MPSIFRLSGWKFWEICMVSGLMKKLKFGGGRVLGLRKVKREKLLKWDKKESMTKKAQS